MEKFTCYGKIKPMKTTSNITKQSASITLSRAEFEKISAIEGVHMGAELSALLQTFIDDGLSHDECRQKLLKHFKAKAA